MNFSGAEFPFFLLSVLLLDALLARRAHAWLRGAAVLLLADLLWTLVARDLRALWDPLGPLALSSLLGVGAHPSALRWGVGTAVFVAATSLGRRHGAALDGPAAQRWTARVASAAVCALGAVVYVAHRHRALDAMSAALSARAHLGFLALYGLALGASTRGDRAAHGVARLVHLFAASALFYHAWAATTRGAYRYLLALILGTILLDAGLARWIDALPRERALARRALLVTSLAANLGVLALFKYFDFFAQSAADGARLLGLDLRVTPVALLLPAGISFHTFQSLSYTIEVYRGAIRATPSPLRFATFVLFFPQLVAGPIVRAESFLPQMEPGASPGLGGVDASRADEGIPRIIVGLAKKLCLADPLAVLLVDGAFANPERFSSVEVLAAAYGYAFQIYLDFSAYSDIAIGAAQLLGFELPENFALPYRARTLQDFWRRWHITLSTWLRDFLYVPLGGSRDGDARTYRNLFVTMLLGGLWHGASWTFIAWGALHGAGLATVRWSQRLLERSPRASRNARVGATVLAIVGALTHATVRAAGAPLTWRDLALAWCWATPAWAAWVAWLDAGSRNDVAGPQPMHVRAAGALSTALTFHYVLAAWVFFRAEDFTHARAVFNALAAFTTDAVNLRRPYVLTLLAAAVAHALGDRGMTALMRAWRASPPPLRALAVAAVALAIDGLSRRAATPFIYFQF